MATMPLNPQTEPHTSFPSSFFKYEDQGQDIDNTAQKAPQGQGRLAHVPHDHGYMLDLEHEEHNAHLYVDDEEYDQHRHRRDEDEDDSSSLDQSSITLSMHSCADTILDYTDDDHREREGDDLREDGGVDLDGDDEETTTIAAHGYSSSVPQEPIAVAHPFPQVLQQPQPVLAQRQQQFTPGSITGTTDSESYSYTTSTPPILSSSSPAPHLTATADDPATHSPHPTTTTTTAAAAVTPTSGGTAVSPPHSPAGGKGPYSHETRTRYARHYSTPTSPSASYGVLAHSIGGGGGPAGLANGSPATVGGTRAMTTGMGVGGNGNGSGNKGQGPATQMYHHRPSSQPAGIGHLSASWANAASNAKSSRTSDIGHGNNNFNNTMTSDSGHGHNNGNGSSSAYHSDTMSSAGLGHGAGNLNDDIDIFRLGRGLPVGNGSSTTFLGPEEGSANGTGTGSASGMRGDRDGGGDAGSRHEPASSVSGISGHRRQLSSGGGGGAGEMDTQKSTTIRSLSHQASAFNPNATNFVSLSRKSTLKKTGFFKSTPAPSNITGRFTIDPNLHVSGALLKALETPSTLVTDLFPGTNKKVPVEVGKKKERRMANLHLDVENGGIDVDIYLVPGLPPPPPPPGTQRSSSVSTRAVKVVRRTTIGARPPIPAPPAPVPTMPVFTPPSPSPPHSEYTPRISSSLAPPGTGSGRFSFDRYNMSEESYVRSGLGPRPSARSRSIDIQPLGGAGYLVQAAGTGASSSNVNVSVPGSAGGTLTAAQKMAVAQAFGVAGNSGGGSGSATPTTTTVTAVESGADVQAMKRPPSGPMPTLIDLRLKEARGGKSRKDGGGKKGSAFGIVARIHAPNPRPPFHLFASVVDIIPYTPSPTPSTGIPPPMPPAPTPTLSRTNTRRSSRSHKPPPPPRIPLPRPPRQPAPVPYSRSASRSPLTIHLPRTFRGPLAVHVGGGDIDEHVKLSRGLEGVCAVVMESAFTRGYFVGRMREDGNGNGDGRGGLKWGFQGQGEVGEKAGGGGGEGVGSSEGEGNGDGVAGDSEDEEVKEEEEDEEEWYGDKVDVFVGNGKVFLQLTGEEDPFGKPGFWKKLTGRA